MRRDRRPPCPPCARERLDLIQKTPAAHHAERRAWIARGINAPHRSIRVAVAHPLRNVAAEIEDSLGRAILRVSARGAAGHGIGWLAAAAVLVVAGSVAVGRVLPPRE